MAVSVQALLIDATNLNKIQMYRPVNTVFLYCSVLPRYLSSAESRPRGKEGGAGGGAGLQKSFLGLKIRGRRLGPWGPSPGSVTVKARWTVWLYSLENCCYLA